MTDFELIGYVDEKGELSLKLPEDFPKGTVKVQVSTIDQPSKSATLGDILNSGLVGAWQDHGITDSVEWVEEMRRKERGQRGW
jgi:hypothetical protein